MILSARELGLGDDHSGIMELPEGPAPGTPLADVLPVRAPERAAVVIGPEGGLAAEEVSALRAAGALVAGLGPRLLRTETAGPVAVALLQARLGDLGTRASERAP